MSLRIPTELHSPSLGRRLQPNQTKPATGQREVNSADRRDVQVLFATGDTLAQQGVERRGLANQDLKRTGRMALYGGGTVHKSPTSNHTSSKPRLT